MSEELILDITGSGQDAMAGSCNENNKPFGVMKGGEFFSKSEQLSVSQDRLMMELVHNYGIRIPPKQFINAH
jgi:hypothetical protein